MITALLCLACLALGVICGAYIGILYAGCMLFEDMPKEARDILDAHYTQRFTLRAASNNEPNGDKTK